MIDKGIKPLVDAMNSTGWIETVSSCSGHVKEDTAYIALFCKNSKLKKLCRILSETENKFPCSVDCSLVFELEVANNYMDAPRGWASLNVTIEPEYRNMVIRALTNSFKEVLD